MQQILKFLQEVKVEFKNIAWPKKDALIQLTFVVISISIIISLILGGFDFIFTQSINLLGQQTNKINQPAIAPVSTIAPVTNIAPTINIVTPTKIIKK
jgi:preprotein translocase subunit SecE